MMNTVGRKLAGILFLSTGLVAGGCGRGDAPDLFPGAWESVPAVEDRSPQPLPAPWQCDLVLEIGEEAGADEYILRSPFALTVLPDGAIVIGDDRPLQLRVYGRDGGHRVSFGQPGGGPDDLAPGLFGWVMRPLGEDTFELWSSWPPRVQRWTTAGELLTVETLSQDHPIMASTAVRTLGFMGEDLYWISTSYRGDREGRTHFTSHVLTGDVAGTSIDTLTSISHEPMPQRFQMALQFGLDFATLLDDHVLVTRQGRCYLTSWLEDWITQVDLQSRRPVLRFRWEHEPEAIPVVVGDRAGDMLGPADQEQLVEGLTWLSERVSLLSLAEGPGGQILVQRTGAPQDDLWPTDVFSPAGEYLGRVLLPVEPRTAVLQDDELVGLGTRQGIPVIRKLRIIRPE